MRMKGRKVGCQLITVGLIMAVLIGLGVSVSGAASQGQLPLRFEISFTKDVASGLAELGLQVPVVGRVFVAISTDGSREPIRLIDVTGVPFWGKDVRNLSAGQPIVIADDEGTLVVGYPLGRLADIPAGEYYVQAFLNVYTTFHRADGHVVEMHLNSGAGQNPFGAPGNVKSRVQRVYLDPESSGTVALTLTEVIPPARPLEEGEVLQQGLYDDTADVKYVKIKSKLVSEFWGQDMYIGANIRLPKGYNDHPDVYYPVHYHQGHFPRGKAGSESDEGPWFIEVWFRHANPYYDDSYAVNSANVGPYGDALVKELIPYIEEHFRIIREPWARILSGGSTGGWEALALQVFYPDFFGGTWPSSPDGVDFHGYQIVDIYEEDNAYYTEYDWTKVERPSCRRSDGNIRFTIRMENLWEYALAPNSRSTMQWAVWEAVYGPVGPDGYPRPIWNILTGEIDHDVAEQWKKYDLTDILRENWSTLGPNLVGKIHMTVGDMDSYYLNLGVYLLEEFLESTTDPYAVATFAYGRLGSHGWRPSPRLANADYADYITENAPEGADTSSWKY